MKKSLIALATLTALAFPAWSKEKPTAIPTELPADVSTSHSLPFGGMTEDPNPIEATPTPVPGPTPEMSQYGWVGTWNWTLAGVGESEGTAQRDSFSYTNYYPYYYAPSTYYTQSGQGQSSSYARSSMAFRLAAEKVLTSSFASGLELDLGTAEVSWVSKSHYYDSYGPYSYDYSYSGIYHDYLVALSWDLRANASGRWVPPGGWRMGWGPRGKAMRPSLDTKFTLLNGFTSGSDNGGYGYYYGYGQGTNFSYWGKIAVNGALPLFNGFTVLVGYANNIRRGFGGYRPVPSIGTRSSFDTENFYETLSLGLELAVPEFGLPDATKDANPDGFLFHPKVSLLYRTFSEGDYGVANSYVWTLKVPVSPGSSLSLATEQFQTLDYLPVLQRYSLAWQLYASRPLPRGQRREEPDTDEVAPIVHPATPYQRPTLPR